MKNKYYNIRGEPITSLEWSIAFEHGSHKVADTTLKKYWISTVWLGLDHNFFGDKPHIFETMVFKINGNMLDLACERYSTLQQALEGHKRMVRKWSKK